MVQTVVGTNLSAIEKFMKQPDLYRIVKKDPDNQEYLYTKAVLLANAQKYDEAIKTYRLLESKTGINEQISVEIQQLYIANNQVDKAFGEIEKLIKDNPTEPKYYGCLPIYTKVRATALMP
ncbi:MAG: hypothetical protein IPF54_22325 [Draconibacterium sp.]|nr:hypothetical protein [Draconibacterium sp.]